MKTQVNFQTPPALTRLNPPHLRLEKLRTKNRMKQILCILAIALSIVACTDDIDKSNRYTFTGETVADYMLNRSDKYSHFINLLERAQ